MTANQMSVTINKTSANSRKRQSRSASGTAVLANSFLGTEGLLGQACFKYVDLAHQIVRDIARKGLKPGDRLGTEDELVKEHELSRNTVRQALAILEKEGFVSRRQRMGTYVQRSVGLSPDKDVAAPQGTVLMVVPECGWLDAEVDLASFTIFRSMVSELGTLGFAVRVVALRGTIAEMRERFALALRVDQVDGICAYSVNMEPFRDLMSDTPLVTVGMRYSHVGCWITLDFEKITYELTKYLIGRGHRRIAIIGGSWSDVRSFSPYASGYRRAFKEANLPFHRELLHQAHEDESLVELADAVLKSQQPTAVFAEEAKVCQAVLAAANALNLKIPDDLSVVSEGQMAHCITSPVRMTVVLPDNIAIGKEAVDRLVDNIRGGNPIPIIGRAGPIVEGESVRTLRV
ncbi:MAG: GntR family transcriptional regulator [Phycisphaerales bacterium]|nr:GntR family transcriptional regulator [Phycisphaerales bacterium]